MKDIDDQIILVTGTTDGLGRGTAETLAMRGARVLLHGRNPAKLEKTAKGIRKIAGNDNIRTYLADLSSLAEVRRLAADIQKNNERLDILINNAGIGFGDPASSQRELSKDGYELRFSVNYLAPFLLTNLLLPCLHKGAPSRILNIASIGQEPIDFDDVMLVKKYSGIRAYRQSKTALVMFTFDLAERIKNENITVNCLHPATYMDTKMVRDSKIEAQSSVRSGVDSVMHIALSPSLDGITGRFFDQKEEGQAIQQAYDKNARNELRKLSEKLTAVKRTP